MIVYILITPAKNEEKYLLNVAESVISQTQRPVLWVIVDDGSTDNSPAIIKNLEKHHDWIQSFACRSIHGTLPSITRMCAGMVLPVQ